MNITQNRLRTALRFILMPWTENKPLALPFGEWEEFDKEQEEQYPIRWFLFDTLPFKIHLIQNRLNNWWWGLCHRFVPKHQYNIIRTSLKPGYYDPDTRILYATMDLIKEFFDEQKDVIAWDDNGEHQRTKETLEELYHWWTEDYPNRKMPDAPKINHRKIFGEKRKQCENDPDVIAWSKWCEEHDRLEQEWADEEEQMLIKAAKIRKYLWYI